MDYGEKHYIVSSAIWAFQVLSDPRFTKHKILMTGRYLIPFILKSKSITINDRPCLGKEVMIVISTQELNIHNKIQTLLPGQEFNVTRKYYRKKFIHYVFLACRNI